MKALAEAGQECLALLGSAGIEDRVGHQTRREEVHRDGRISPGEFLSDDGSGHGRALFSEAPDVLGKSGVDEAELETSLREVRGNGTVLVTIPGNPADFVGREARDGLADELLLFAQFEIEHGNAPSPGLSAAQARSQARNCFV